MTHIQGLYPLPTVLPVKAAQVLLAKMRGTQVDGEDVDAKCAYNAGWEIAGYGATFLPDAGPFGGGEEAKPLDRQLEDLVALGGRSASRSEVAKVDWKSLIAKLIPLLLALFA